MPVLLFLLYPSMRYSPVLQFMCNTIPVKVLLTNILTTLALRWGMSFSGIHPLSMDWTTWNLSSGRSLYRYVASLQTFSSRVPESSSVGLSWYKGVNSLIGAGQYKKIWEQTVRNHCLNFEKSTHTFLEKVLKILLRNEIFLFGNSKIHLLLSQ